MGKLSLYDKAMDLAQRVGPVFGFMVGFFYAVAYLIYFFGDHDLSNLAQSAFGLGFGFLAAGLGRGQKKAAEIQVKAAAMLAASEAEKRIVNPNLPPSSIVPEIQEQIEKQTKEGG